MEFGGDLEESPREQLCLHAGTRPCSPCHCVTMVVTSSNVPCEHQLLGNVWCDPVL